MTVVCLYTGLGECWNCGGSTRSIDPVTGKQGPFEGDRRFCSEECCAEADERWERERLALERQRALCPECGFDNQEHDDGCSRPCPRCSHARAVHEGGVCRVAFNELPSCAECAAPLAEMEDRSMKGGEDG